MDEQTAERLLALNREFYAAFAHAFADSRSISDPALTSILPYISHQARVLDVGCGNGRLAFLLDRGRPGVSYVGVDAVEELIKIARAQAVDLTNVTADFRVADVARPGWSAELLSPRRQKPAVAERRRRLESDPLFDCIALLAVLHHVPGFERRARVLSEAADVLKPGGCMILSTWQFLDSERMRRKIVDWSEVGIPPGKLDPGDYLLDWKRGGRGLRYCHLVDRAEVEQLAAASGLHVRETFRAGGREGDLSLFAVLDVCQPPVCEV